MTRARHIEEAEQCMVVEWAKYQRSPWGDSLVRHLLAIPNGAYLGGTAGQRRFQMARLKAMGLQDGASDLFVMVPRDALHGLWIELKKPRKAFRGPAEARRAVSESQLEFGRLRMQAGYAFTVCYGAMEAIELIERYLAGHFAVEREAVPA